MGKDHPSAPLLDVGRRCVASEMPPSPRDEELNNRLEPAEPYSPNSLNLPSWCRLTVAEPQGLCLRRAEPGVSPHRQQGNVLSSYLSWSPPGCPTEITARETSSTTSPLQRVLGGKHGDGGQARTGGQDQTHPHLRAKA